MKTSRGAPVAVRVVLAASGALLAVLLLGAPASAAEVSGCQGTAQSFDAAGQPVDMVAGPGAGGTKADPFTVDPDGVVRYSGTTTDVLQNGRWKVEVGFGFDISGRVTNASGQNSWSDEEKVSDRLPFDAPGLYHVRFTVSGAPGTTSCTGSVWVEVDGSPVFTPVWIGGGVVFLLGAAELVSTVASAVRGG